MFDLSLNRISNALESIGNPHLHLPPTIHIAGTNGKCSTLTFMRYILESAGYKVHQFTSPHLLKINERILLAGNEITDEHLNELFQGFEPVAKKYKLSWFEFLTLIAMEAYSKTPGDVLLLETGLAGKFDATNVIPRPLASVITPISFDHMHYLGSTLKEITGAKAGIIKQDVPVFSAYQENEVRTVLSRTAQALNCSFYEESRDWQIYEHKDHWELNFKNETMELPYPQNLRGRHQLQNAALAIATLKTLNLYTLNHFQMSEVVRSAYVQGRIMPVKTLPSGSSIWFDGGHNPSAAKVLVDFFKEKRLTCIIGMLNTKNPKEFIETLKPSTDQFIFIPIAQNSLSFSPDELCQFDPLALPAASLKEALLKVKEKTATILICGSFYLAHEVFDLKKEIS